MWADVMFVWPYVALCNESSISIDIWMIFREEGVNKKGDWMETQHMASLQHLDMQTMFPIPFLHFHLCIIHICFWRHLDTRDASVANRTLLACSDQRAGPVLLYRNIHILTPQREFSFYICALSCWFRIADVFYQFNYWTFLPFI